MSVRKSTIRKIDGVVHEKYYVYSKQGSTRIQIKEIEPKNYSKKLVPTKRCGCDPQVRIKLDIFSGDVFVKHVEKSSETCSYLKNYKFLYERVSP